MLAIECHIIFNFTCIMNWGSSTDDKLNVISNKVDDILTGLKMSHVPSQSREVYLATVENERNEFDILGVFASDSTAWKALSDISCQGGHMRVTPLKLNCVLSVDDRVKISR